MRIPRTLCILLGGLLVLASAAAVTAADVHDSGDWLWSRTTQVSPSLATAAWSGGPELGGGIAAGGGTRVTGSLARPLLLSLLMPGLGEVSMGYRRGWAMMALDVAAWIGVKHYHDEGNDARQAYYDYLDAHWSEQRLANAFGEPVSEHPGTFFYGDTMEDPTDYTTLSLWVSKEDDRREYYENAGKWDQFVFGWDDFSDPRGWPVEWWQETDPTWTQIGDLDTRILKDPRVSAHRETYRAMRKHANDQFDKRDRLVYFNMLTRLASMIQVAVLHHRGRDLRVAGHRVSLLAEPRGLTRSRLGLAISY